mmetsp:Transcript_24343/g.48426  ORF Transcript_24343/g.48426 Transcript_24343/m.48426 type:complete len:244 (-) Transcript_24343:951-1682(-)
MAPLRTLPCSKNFLSFLTALDIVALKAFPSPFCGGLTKRPKQPMSVFAPSSSGSKRLTPSSALTKQTSMSFTPSFSRYPCTCSEALRSDFPSLFSTLVTQTTNCLTPRSSSSPISPLTLLFSKSLASPGLALTTTQATSHAKWLGMSSAEKREWPGLSMKLYRFPPCWWVTMEGEYVTPRSSSAGRVSMRFVVLGGRLEPVEREVRRERREVTRVDLPWSTCPTKLTVTQDPSLGGTGPLTWL